MDVFVARQPILDRRKELHAYELLFRSGETSSSFDGAESSYATTHIIASSVLAIGLDRILCGKKAFLNFDRNLLMGDLLSILPPENIVVEILETVEPDAELVAACRKLRQDGYLLALDDFVADPRMEPLIDLAHLIKVDIRATPRAEQERLLSAYKPRGIAMLAEKVETQEEFEWAKGAGFDLFQGYFFARPALVRGRQIPAFKLPCLLLLTETHKAELDYALLADIIRQDPSLCYKLLRYSNSGLFNFRSEIRSIRHALAVLGESGIRHWVALATLPVLAKDKPGELITHALVRARFCECMAETAHLPDPGQAFLTGLVSLLDAFVDLPLLDVLIQVNVSAEIQAAVLGNGSDRQDHSALGTVYRIACQFQEGDWLTAAALARETNISPSEIQEAYERSTLWVQEALNGSARKADLRRHDRHTVSGIVSIFWKHGDGRQRTYQAKLVNVSPGGMQLEVADELPIGTLVNCGSPKLGISGTGAVRYCSSSEGKYLVGLEFSDGTGWKKSEQPTDH